MGIPGLLTSNLPVQQLLSQLLPIYALMGFADSVQTILCAIIRALRWPFAASAVYVVVYYLIMVPVAWMVAFHSRWGVLGMWWSTLVGTSLVGAIFLWMLRGRSFEEAGEAAAQRLHEN